VSAAEIARGVGRAGRNRRIAVVTAIIAVLAALGTLFAHHRSIGALSLKNQAILKQARATDTYNAYEAKQIRYNIYRALLSSELVRDAKTRARLETVADQEHASSPAVLERARSLEAEATNDDERSEAILKSYEILQTATTAFEVSIVLVSISALAATRILLPFACALSGVGLVLFVAGLLQGR
jgi:hypothetical protein